MNVCFQNYLLNTLIGCILFYFVFYFTLFYYFLLSILPDCNFPSLQCSQPASPFPRAGLPGISSKHSVTRYNKTRHKVSYQGWIREHYRKKKVTKPRETEIPPLLWESHKNRKLYNHTYKQ